MLNLIATPIATPDVTNATVANVTVERRRYLGMERDIHEYYNII